MPNTILENYSLKNENTLRIDAKARYFAVAKNKLQLTQLLENVVAEKFILGGGSNTLITGDIEGLVIKNSISGITIVEETSEHILLKIGAGENWHELVMYCVAHNYGGIENLSLIPGTVGAAPIQNIGAYGVELESVFYSLTAIQKTTLQEKIFYHNDCQFAYRHSIFKQELKNQFIITDVTLRLNKIPQYNVSYGNLQATLMQMGVKEISLRSISDAVISIRQSKLPDPIIIPNAGSFFKNPMITAKQFDKLKSDHPEIPHFPASANQIKIPAAWLIERCGWKGKKLGRVGVHDQQALVLVNHGSGSGQEILQLAQLIQQDVLEKFSIKLEMEVNIV